MLKEVHEFATVLGPWASVVNFLLILLFFKFACKMRDNDLLHVNKTLTQLHSDLQDLRLRVDRLVDPK